MDNSCEKGVMSEVDDDMSYQHSIKEELFNCKAKHLPFWKSGSGYYGNTLGRQTRNLLASFEDTILSYLDTIPVKENEVFTIGDYGANDGYASMPLFCRMIGHLRKKHGEGLPIQIIYEDQENNDFNSLFRGICDQGSSTTAFGNTYCLATNTNFYKQCVPDATCDIILTNLATQWLETMETTFKDSVFHVFATKEESQHFQREAERDWNKFLLLRARELKSGGLLIALNLSAYDESIGDENSYRTTATDDGNGQKRAYQTITHEDVFADIEAAWRQLREDKVITQDEYEGCSVMEAIRTPNEITAPFSNANSPVRQAGLTLVSHDQMVHRAIRLAFGTEKEDRHHFAERLCKAHRVWSQTSFEHSLSNTRCAKDKTAILDRLYKEMERRVTEKNPENYMDDYILSRLIVRKI